MKYALIEALQTLDMKSVDVAASMCIRALKRGNKILLCGNGGSAADCQHIAAEFTGRYKKERQGLAAISLTTDTSALTAIANDYGYEEVFARQIEALGKEGDVLIAISTSGRSGNILRAIATARDMGIETIGLGGTMEADLCITVASSDTARIQEVHMFIGHEICRLTEDAMLGTIGHG